MKEETFNKYFNSFVLIGMVVALIITTGLKLGNAQTGKMLLIVSALGSLMGVLSTVMAANGKIITFLFGLIDVSIYGVMCFINWREGSAGLGNAILHVAYFVPMQFVGFFQWRKAGAHSNTKPKAKRLSGKQWILFSLIFLAGSVLAYLILARFDKSAAQGFIRVAVILDVIPLMCNILGQLLMSTAYMEQWIFWIGVNIFTILLWSFSIKETGSDFAVIYIVKYSFYLINSVNGLRNWIIMSRSEPSCISQ